MDQSSSSEGNSARNDIEKLHQMWKSLKKQKRQSRQPSQMSELRNAIQIEEEKNLQVRLMMTQKQLSKSRENTALLMKKLSEAEGQIQNLEFELGKQKRECEELREQLELMLLQQNHKEETFGKSNQYSREEHEKELKNYQLKHQMNEKELNRLHLKIKSFEFEKTQHQLQLNKLQELNQGYLEKLNHAENTMNDLYLGQQVQGAKLLQLDEAYSTIQRLVLLLRGTEQYQQLGEFAQDVENIHFLRNIPKRLKENKLINGKNLCTCMNVRIDEKLLWTASSSYKILLQMKIKYQSLTEDCIEEVLFQLNKIWLAREQAHIQRVKENYENQIQKLKKKNQQKYDEIVARKQIQRLKKELQSSRKSIRKTRQPSLEKLKNIGQYEDEFKIKEKEIKLLQERIKLIGAEKSIYDKRIYLEGTLWIIEKIIKELTTNDKDMREFESQFRQKIQSNIATEDWLRSFKEFFENITELQNEVVEKLLSMKESTQKKIVGQSKIQ